MGNMIFLAMTLVAGGVLEGDGPWQWQLVVSDGNTGAVETYTSGQSFKIKSFGQHCEVTIGLPYVNPASPDHGPVQSAYLYCKLPAHMSTGTSCISGPAIPSVPTMLNIYGMGKGITYKLQRLEH